MYHEYFAAFFDEKYYPLFTTFVVGAVASWVVCSTPERAVRVRVLAGDIALCSWARHFTLTVPLSTQVYKWVPVNCWRNLTNWGEVTCDGLASRPREVEILLAASCYRNRDKLRQLWASLGSKASLFSLRSPIERDTASFHTKCWRFRWQRECIQWNKLKRAKSFLQRLNLALKRCFLARLCFLSLLFILCVFFV